jgi:hypothetical protein
VVLALNHSSFLSFLSSLSSLGMVIGKPHRTRPGDDDERRQRQEDDNEPRKKRNDDDEPRKRGGNDEEELGGLEQMLDGGIAQRW